MKRLLLSLVILMALPIVAHADRCVIQEDSTTRIILGPFKNGQGGLITPESVELSLDTAPITGETAKHLWDDTYASTDPEISAYTLDIEVPYTAMVVKKRTAGIYEQTMRLTYLWTWHTGDVAKQRKDWVDCILQRNDILH